MVSVMEDSTSMRSPRTAGGLRRGDIATMITGRSATAMVDTATGTRWSLQMTGRTEGEAWTGGGDLKAAATGPSTTEGGAPPDTGAETEAGSGIDTETLGGPNRLTSTERDLEVDPQAESGSVAVGRMRRTGGPTARRGRAGSAATPRPPGAGSPTRPPTSERKIERRKRKRRRSC